MKILVAKHKHRLNITLLDKVPLKFACVEEFVICGLAPSEPQMFTATTTSRAVHIVFMQLVSVCGGHVEKHVHCNRLAVNAEFSCSDDKW